MKGSSSRRRNRHFHFQALQNRYARTVDTSGAALLDLCEDSLSDSILLLQFVRITYVVDRLETGIYMYMQASTCRWKHIYVDDSLAYTGRCFSAIFHLSLSSICICFSSGVPAILPYFTNQSCFSGFHRPPAAFAFPQFCFVTFDAEWDKAVCGVPWRRRYPLSPLDNQFDRL